jgi:hypothetical protein
MSCRPFALIAVAFLALGMSGCVGSTKVGLTNVRAREWHQARANNPSDAVADGDDSCEREGSSRPDPTPNRLYRCPGTLPEGTRVASPK